MEIYLEFLIANMKEVDFMNDAILKNAFDFFDEYFKSFMKCS